MTIGGFFQQGKPNKTELEKKKSEVLARLVR
jgi:hypothetical protein